jgi:hypothetical protein
LHLLPPDKGVFLELTISGFFCQSHPFHFLTDALVIKHFKTTMLLV